MAVNEETPVGFAPSGVFFVFKIPRGRRRSRRGQSPHRFALQHRFGRCRDILAGDAKMGIEFTRWC